METKFIKSYNTLYPNGYNLTEGGQCISKINIKNNSELNGKKTKRGREFGYKHKKSTKDKMSNRLKKISIEQGRDVKMSSVMKDHYDQKKIDILSQYDLDDDITKYIKPVHNKQTGLLHNYVIKIDKRKLTLRSSESLEKKYENVQK